MGMALDPKEVEREYRQDWRERALKAEAEVVRLRDALEPIARRVVPDHYDDKTLIGWISAGEIRAARAALTQGESRQTTPAAPTPADGGGE
jgi:hypothetical protein